MHHWICRLGWAILAATLLKLALVVFADPMVGYANNADFGRASACTGVWHAQNGAVAEADHKRPHNELLYAGKTDRNLCLKSSDNLFPRLARLGLDQGDSLDFRRVAAWRFASVVLIAVALGFVLRRQPAVLLAAAVAFYLVFGDMGVMSYFNTLYTEFSVVAGLFLLSAACVWLVGTPRRPPAVPALSLFALSGLWLGWSKQQYGILAGAVLACAALVWWLRWRQRGIAAGLLALAVGIPLVYLALNPSDRLVSAANNRANKVNTFLWAVLPTAKDPQRTLQALGLPPHCAAAIGQNWWTPGFQQNHPCPEVVQASRMRLAGQFLVDPGLFWRPMVNGIQQFRPMYPFHLGRYEAPQDEHAPRYRTMVRSSMTHWFEALSDAAFLAVMAVLPLLGLVAGLAALVLLRRGEATGPQSRLFASACTMVALGGATVFYALASSVFGDGYSDFPKHAVGGLVGLAFALAGFGLLLWQLCVALRARNAAR